MGTLFLVSTPIGNLDDITIRALKVLFTVDGIACEDTRKTGQMLKLLRERYLKMVIDDSVSIPEQRLISYYEENEFRRIPDIITALKNGLSIALVSDAGTPSVSDPGYRIVTACLQEGIAVVPVPGSSSVLAGLVASGLPTDKFIFLGYPPHKSGKRIQLYEKLKNSQEYIQATAIFFEAPHKLIKTLEEMLLVFGNINIVLARELTKVHEEFVRLQLSEALEKYKKTAPKGEFVILIHFERD
jgi:16S rRNA (cytidine1402-2'-O)-methyltransferase